MANPEETQCLQQPASTRMRKQGLVPMHRPSGLSPFKAEHITFYVSKFTCLVRSTLMIVIKAGSSPVNACLCLTIFLMLHLH